MTTNADEITTPFDILQTRANWRTMEKAGMFASDNLPVTEPSSMDKATIGFRDTGEFKSYVEFLSYWARIETFNENDKVELMKPVAAYCQENSLDVAEFMAVRELRIGKVFAKGMSDESKEALDFAMYRMAEEGEEFTKMLAKSALFSANLLDTLFAPSSREDLYTAIQNSRKRLEERDPLIDANFVVYQKKFAEKYNHTA